MDLIGKAAYYVGATISSWFIGKKVLGSIGLIDKETTSLGGMDAQKRRMLRQQKPAHWGGLKSVGVFEKEEGGERIMRSVVYCQNMHRKAIHPTEKPIGILIPLILSSVPENGVVLDPFMGSGSTLRAARELGRRSIGIEINEAYCEAAVKALSQNVMVLV